MNGQLLIGVFSLICRFGFAGQGPQEALRSPNPDAAGPSPQVTMKFIQDKMNEQGQVGSVATHSDLAGVTFRTYYTISNALADPTTCSLRTTETIRTDTELADGSMTSKVSLQDAMTFFDSVEQIVVESMQSFINRSLAEQAHPEKTVTITPTVFSLVLSGSKPMSSFNTYAQGKRPPQMPERSGRSNLYAFRDEETANRVAKAMVHAVELCGGGRKDPF